MELFCRNIKWIARFGSAVAYLFIGAHFVLAEDVGYLVQGYGSRHAVVILNGLKANTVTTNLGKDGQTVRISGVNVSFVEQSTRSIPALISNVQQVRRGAFTDLIFNLSSECSLTATPGSSDMKIFIKSKATGKTKPKLPGTTLVNSKGLKPREILLPIKFLIDGEVPVKEKNLKTLPFINVVLPDSSGIRGLTSLAQELRASAYAIDILWAWVVGQEFDVYTDAPAAAQRDKEVEELETLVRDLTQELVELRKDLLSQSENNQEKKPLAQPNNEKSS